MSDPKKVHFKNQKYVVQAQIDYDNLKDITVRLEIFIKILFFFCSQAKLLLT